MERLILSPRTELFSGKRDFLKARPRFPNGILEWKSAFHLLLFTIVPAFWLGSPLILSSGKKLWKWNERIPMKISILSIDAYHLQQLWTNRFLRVNGKQPYFPRCKQKYRVTVAVYAN